MKIIVPIKQVPETSNVRMDHKTGTIVRESNRSVVNPLDLYSIEAALRLKEKHGGSISVVSMGPAKAEVAVREAIAMGCDHGTLVSDRAFAGSDTWATSYILAQAIRRLGDYDLIICGERATDGDTGQVGPGIASWLGVPCATYASSVNVMRDGALGASAPSAPASAAAKPGRSRAHGAAEVPQTEPASLIVERLLEDGYETLEVQLPALVTVVKEIARPRLPTMAGKKRASVVEVQQMTAGDLELEPTYVGLKGSPTRVVRIRTPKVARDGVKVDARESTAGVADGLVDFLKGKQLLGGVE